MHEAHWTLVPHPGLEDVLALADYRVLIPGLGRSSGKGNGNPLQYYCLENPTDRGAWWVHGVAKSRTRLGDFTFTFTHCSTREVPSTVFLCLSLAFCFLSSALSLSRSHTLGKPGHGQPCRDGRGLKPPTNRHVRERAWR